MRIYPVNLEGQLMTAWRNYREHAMHGRTDSERLARARVDAILDEWLRRRCEKASEKASAPR